MIKIITGDKGKGKTKYLLDMANDAVKTSKGSLVYLDKSSKHMFELDRSVRLINVFDYPVCSLDAFIGFIAGIISQDHDLSVVFIDSFLMMTDISTGEKMTAAVEALEKISKLGNVDFVMTISRNKEDLPASLQELVIQSL